jgi:hypothetical protein
VVTRDPSSFSSLDAAETVTYVYGPGIVYLPEPSGIILMGPGLAGAGVWAWRQGARCARPVNLMMSYLFMFTDS